MLSDRFCLIAAASFGRAEVNLPLIVKLSLRKGVKKKKELKQKLSCNYLICS